MLGLSGYLGLFLSALVAATLLPAQSEALLAGLVFSEDFSLTLLWLAATSGNVLGSMINWYLGTYIERFSHRRWFPVSEKQLAKAHAFYQKYGRWSLLLSWMPIIGDPITLVAGVMKEPFWRFSLIVTLAKGLRYLVVIGITLAAV
ncbi:YqaA family protein [Pelagibaculum spongiae]|uniref:VTT domain-containing protein n=1 Tax=Pelagibaculum spongiae TaxID=2080658 RepID=A0A2V1H4R6_9GAMM|nr:YqaA family protein [Pelagibaculum spongiae]PVZ72218.1 hypothetical protein DC094_04170 [Pelagibaculum spongiae]